MYATEYALLGGNAKAMDTTENALNVIREGLPVDMIDHAGDVLCVTKSDLVPLIGGNLRSFQRKKKDSHLTPQQSEHTLAIIGVLTSATEYFSDRETALTWMKTPQMVLGNKSAFSYLDTMAGISFVNDIINRMKYGMTA
ncbi:antitoxin Xre/MbcA/ParS toxin-binding domain-containing protein [Kiloniella antarctica]|uniref:Antitoxin Xre/MbcA/ParS toxin-binding domain-containing protein n=1 Tax=Kiloniella antarctica TaxID=1550907 RepID=A0ABW5BMI0_9PROT